MALRFGMCLCPTDEQCGIKCQRLPFVNLHHHHELFPSPHCIAHGGFSLSLSLHSLVFLNMNRIQRIATKYFIFCCSAGSKARRMGKCVVICLLNINRVGIARGLQGSPSMRWGGWVLFLLRAFLQGN